MPYLLLLLVVGPCLLIYPKGTFLLWLNEHHTNYWDTFFLTANGLGEEIFAGVAILALAIFTNYGAALAAGSSWLLSGIITQGLKQLVFEDMARPKHFFKGLKELYFVPGVKMYEHFSFPSGHTTVAFALCTVLALSVTNRAWGLFFFVVAVFAALSRIYLAQHFLMDTFFGSMIGTITGLLVYNLMQMRIGQQSAHILNRNMLKSLRG